MKKIFDLLPSIIFGLIETAVIILLGIHIGIDLKEIIIVLIVFAIMRVVLKDALHYKNPIECFIWTTLLFVSVWILAKAGIVVSVLMTILAGIFLSGKGNIKDVYMWKGKDTNYDDIDEFIKKNYDDPRLAEFEHRLQEQDEFRYQIYKTRFKEQLNFTKTAEKLEMDSKRLSEKMNEIACAFRIFFNFLPYPH